MANSAYSGVYPKRSWPCMGACPVSAGVRTPLRWAFCSRAKSKKRSRQAAGAVPAYPRPLCHVAVTSTVIPAPTFEGHGTPAHVPVRESKNRLSSACTNTQEHARSESRKALRYRTRKDRKVLIWKIESPPVRQAGTGVSCTARWSRRPRQWVGNRVVRYTWLKMLAAFAIPRTVPKAAICSRAVIISFTRPPPDH